MTARPALQMASALSRLLSEGLTNAPQGITHIPSFNDFGSGLGEEVEAEIKTCIKGEKLGAADDSAVAKDQPEKFAGQGYAEVQGHTRCAPPPWQLATCPPSAPTFLGPPTGPLRAGPARTCGAACSSLAPTSG